MSKRKREQYETEKQARNDDRKGRKDAYCTECGCWYDSNGPESNRHAH